MPAVAEDIEGQFVIIDRFGNGDKARIAFETILAVDLRIETI